jgi:hypothetical protein
MKLAIIGMCVSVTRSGKAWASKFTESALSAAARRESSEAEFPLILAELPGKSKPKVEPLISARHARGSEVMADPGAAGLRATAGDLRDGLHHLPHRVDEEAGFPVAHNFRNAAAAKGDYRRAASYRFQGDQRTGFRAQAGNEQRGGMAQQPDFLRQRRRFEEEDGCTVLPSRFPIPTPNA